MRNKPTKFILILAAIFVGLFAPAGSVSSEEPIDFVQLNGAIFVDWPRPDVVLLFSGEMDGYLEPCGCAGLENQKGGLKRRHALIQQLEAKDWPVIAMDLGGQVKRFGAQAEIKFRFGLDSLIELGYEAVALGSSDLRMDLLPVVINWDESKNPLVSANVGILDFESGFTRRYKIIEKGGMRIGVTSVLGKSELARFKNVADLVLEQPYQAIPLVLPQLRNANCDQRVLLVHGEQDEAKELARRFPEFNWVVAAKGADEPPNEPAKIGDAASRLVEVGHKGMYVTVVGLYKNSQPPFRYQRVPLDGRFEDTEAMQAMLVAYQRELETIGLDGLGVKPILHPTGREFAGSESCADCHSQASETFAHTPHAHATQSIVELDPPRHFDAECLSCHVTGWEPQKYYPFTTGYLGLKKTPHLTANGCENCHGPAARHVAVENGDLEVDSQEQQQLRTDLRLKIVENEGNQDGQAYGQVVRMCMQCHDQDNSPDFDFQHYWPEVAHEGKD